MSDPTGDYLKARAKAAKPPATSRGSGTVTRASTAIGRAVAARRKAEEAAQDAAKTGTSTKAQPPRKRKPRRSADIHAAKARSRTPETAKGRILDPSKIENR